jgi:putative phosphoesterase
MPKPHLIGILSDTHDNRPNIRKAVQHLKAQEVGLILHAGDFIAPFTASDFDGIPCPFIGVFGNNDGERIGLSRSYARIGALHAVSAEVTQADRRIYVRHEPDAVEAIAASGQYDLVVYGHTHHIDIRQKGAAWIVNPGECGGWTTGRATIVVFDLDRMEPTLAEI